MNIYLDVYYNFYYIGWFNKLSCLGKFDLSRGKLEKSREA